jgi:hypothetical protein
MTDNYWQAQVARLESENSDMIRAMVALQEELARKDAELAALRAAYYRMAVQVNGLADHAEEVANE